MYMYGRSGALDWEAFWWCIKGLGLGLSDDEIHAAHKRAGHTAAGEVMWADFVPVAGALLQKSTHPFGDYSRHANNPWARMFDRDSSSHYYFNRKTQVGSIKLSRVHDSDFLVNYSFILLYAEFDPSV